MAKEKINKEAMYRVFKLLWFTKEVSFVALNEEDLQYSIGTYGSQTAIDVGKAIGEVVAIDWRDRDGGWTEFIRLKIKINVLCPLRRVVHLVGRDGSQTICAIKYEMLR
ncbi:hypothetical protein Goari_021991 [Gossypium aridum]|uniref:Uncharacterized protein n=1 Tax=Gossypium aridum TaxID=34290 RepID=A0A7J8YRJ4_GOSAI|nr:hypothetical protein [Gossypium aridum]